MKYYSTKNQDERLYSFKDSLFKGLADDGGLLMPTELPEFSEPTKLSSLTFPEFAAELLYKFVDEIDYQKFSAICKNVFTFEPQIKAFNENLSIIELFTGPTLAFKDYGARFLAGMMEYYLSAEGTQSLIIVATSGDTGGAVASAFHNSENVKVVLLYPKDKISKLQEKQLTTFGGNIHALSVLGDFDDCQRLVKSALNNQDIKRRFNLNSANSINIGRLLPQSVYYSYCSLRNDSNKRGLNIFVPSGNLGNLTSGLISKLMGFPINHFVAALNANNMFSDYIRYGKSDPKPTIQTVSNAMDVGSPSNLERIADIRSYPIYDSRLSISSDFFSDAQILKKIYEFWDQNNYLIDPHTAVGVLAYEKHGDFDKNNFVLSTAHPAKFMDILKRSGISPIPELPHQLAEIINLESKATTIEPDFEIFAKYLIENID